MEKKRSGVQIRWACSLNRSAGCRGAVTTDQNPIANPRHHVAHNHHADHDAVEYIKFRANLRENASANVTASTRNIIAAGVNNLPQNALLHVGPMDTLRRDVQRHKSKNRPVEPIDLASIALVFPWTTTGGAAPQPFLIYDSGPMAANNRVLVFAAPDALTQLGSTDWWYMDGNFKCAPNIFMQLYVIRGRLDSGAVTCVYALLPGKSGQIYTEMFQAVQTEMLRMGVFPNVSHVSVDFEIAAYDAVRAVFGNQITIHGCFFHLTQSTDKHVGDLGLRQLVRNDARAARFVAMMDGLAFLPLNDVVLGARLLQNVIPNSALQPLFNYFMEYYVLGPVVAINPIQRGPPPPMFPPAVWNVFDTTLRFGGTRTNNICEGWNHAFNNMVGARHPPFYRLLEFIQRDYSYTRVALAASNAGTPHTPRKRRNYVQHQNNLKRLCTLYSQRHPQYVGHQGIILYLERIAQNIHLDF